MGCCLYMLVLLDLFGPLTQTSSNIYIYIYIYILICANQAEPPIFSSIRLIGSQLHSQFLRRRFTTAKGLAFDKDQFEKEKGPSRLSNVITQSPLETIESASRSGPGWVLGAQKKALRMADFWGSKSFIQTNSASWQLICANQAEPPIFSSIPLDWLSASFAISAAPLHNG